LRKLKRHVGRAVYQLLAPRVSPSGSDIGHGPPVVAGFLSTPSGLGESARLCHAALESLGLTPRYFDFGRRFANSERLDVFVDDDEPNWNDAGPLIVHANPPELPAVCFRLGKRALNDRLVVGYWAWELEQIPSSWVAGFRYVHEIWAPSRFVADAIRPHTKKPVRVVPHPLLPLSARSDRGAFGLAETDLVVLSACDLRSSAERKNIDGNIEAFRAAFGSAEDVTLIVKLGGTETYPELAKEIQDKVDSFGNIRTVTAVLSPQRMADLIASVDIVLSLHRSEGFGLLPAQAMMLGKPSIATYWSGNMDYMSVEASIRIPPKRLVPVRDAQGIYPYPSQRWAEPDLDLAAEALRHMADDPEERRRLGESAAVAIREHCSVERYWQACGPDFQRLCTPGAQTGD